MRFTEGGSYGRARLCRIQTRRCTIAGCGSTCAGTAGDGGKECGACGSSDWIEASAQEDEKPPQACPGHGALPDSARPRFFELAKIRPWLGSRGYHGNGAKARHCGS